MTHAPDADSSQRRSIRLREYDYSQAGAHFVTICTQDRRCLFGEIVDGEMRLNDAGDMVTRWWNELPRKFPYVRTDQFVVMPDHMHGIIMIVGADLRVRPRDNDRDTDGRPHRGAPTLGGIVRWFKTMTTNEYIRGVKHHAWPPFPRRLWQRNYYEHVIRNEHDLTSCREYTDTNPASHD